MSQSGELLTVQGLRVGEVLLELLVQVFADSYVLEHSLELGRVLEATGLLLGGRTDGLWNEMLPNEMHNILAIKLYII